MNEGRAIAAVEESYGSLEDFAFHVLSEHPEVLESETALAQTARLLSLDPGVVYFILNRSMRFRMLIRSDLVNQEFNLVAEKEHIREVKKVAVNTPQQRMTAKGDMVEVGQAPGDMMAAGTYLNKYRGTPIDQGRERMMVGVQVNFVGGTGNAESTHDSANRELLEGGTGEGSASGDGRRAVNVEALSAENAQGEVVYHHVARRAGDLPPSAARERYRIADGRQIDAVGSPGGEYDFYSAEAEEQARDHEDDARTRRYQGESAVDEEIPSRPEASGRGRKSLMERLRENEPASFPKGA